MELFYFNGYSLNAPFLVFSFEYFSRFLKGKKKLSFFIKVDLRSYDGSVIMNVSSSGGGSSSSSCSSSSLL
jgi:hypothetical protein